MENERAWNQAAKLVIGHILRVAVDKGPLQSRADGYRRAEAISLMAGVWAEFRIFGVVLDRSDGPTPDERAAWQLAKEAVATDQKQRERIVTTTTQFDRWAICARKYFDSHRDKIQAAVELGHVPVGDELDILCGLRCRSTVRFKRSSLDMEAFKTEIAGIVEQYAPMTVRQLFYQLVVRNLIEKDELQYQAVSRQLVKLRREGVVPWDSIVDLTRRKHEPAMFDDPADAIDNMIGWYRLDPWKDAPVRPWIWIEKDALLGVVAPVCEEFRVPVCPGRGFGSETFIHEIAMDIVDRGQTAAIYEFGDHDPSGLLASDTTNAKLMDFIHEAGGNATFTRVAVTPAQIADMDLPSRPTKTSNHSKDWVEGEDSTELDAIPPDVLRAMVQEVIERHTNDADFDATYEQEELDKATLVSRFH